MKWKKFTNRKRIGVFVHQYQSEIWHPLIEKSKDLDVDIIFFTGRSLNSPYETEIPQNYIYDVADYSFIDGLLIFSGTIANFISKEEYKTFLAKYENIPCVSVFLKVDGLPSVLIDNKKGIKKLLKHLLNEHNYKRYVFISGPENNSDAKERLSGFMEFLEEEKLEKDSQLIINGDFRYESGVEAVAKIIDKMGNFDAIVCSNDNMAIGVINYFIQKKLKLPIAVTGFDNIISSEAMIPPLTTVDVNIEGISSKSLELLVKMINGEDVEELIYVEPELVVRNSCGCMNDKESNLKYRLKKDDFYYKDFVGAFYKFKDFKGGDEEKNFFIELARKIEKEEFYIPYFVESVLKDNKKEDIFLILKFLDYLWNLVDRVEKNRLNYFYYEMLMLRILTRDISCDLNLEDLTKHLVEKLPTLGISDFYLFIFDEVKYYPVEKDIFPNLKFCLQDGEKVEIPLKLKEIPLNKNYIFLPLSGKSEVFGFIILNYIENDIIYEILREQLSSTLKHIDTLQKKIKAEKELEKTLFNLNKLSEKYFSMLEYLPSAVFEVNKELRIEFLNKNAKELLMINEKDNNLYFLDFVFPEDRNRFHNFYNEMKSGKYIQEINEIRLVKRNGNLIHFLFNIVPILESGEIKGARISGFDIRPILSKSFSIDEDFYKTYNLSPREREVLNLWIQGYQIKEIASALFIAESTVKIHIGSIYSKLDVKSKSEFFNFIKDYQIKRFGYESFLFSILSQLIKN
jgi:DNA-binding LacI/PurR family transcriptional regulator/DNA-binding CsgD family transcriptional regulator